MARPAAVLADAGLILGRYRPLRPLGAGGSGSVWLARDETARVPVALKIVAREGKAGARAEREGAAAARLRHPCCLRAYALARDAQHVYIAYEYVPGRTLREALADRELDDADAVEAVAQVLDALAHAHAQGIVHRDVKPANVLLADGDSVSVRLFDFGLATLEDAEALTAHGDVPGTLAYIAPERLRGAEATPASDVWAAGVLLWEALAGHHPFRRGSVAATPRAAERGVPPLASVRPDLPSGLVGAVDRAVALQPSRRPDAARLARALRGSLGETTVQEGGGGRRVAFAPADRVAPSALAAVFAGVVAAALPFYPQGSAPVVGGLAGALAFVHPRAGLAFALAVPVLPLGNHALGLALVYAAFAAAWLALFAREPRWGLLAALGPLVAPLGALALAPLLVQPLRSPVRRAAAAAGAVLAAAVAAGVRAAPLPLTGDGPPRTLGIVREESPWAVARALGEAAAAHPGLLVAALVFAAAAAAFPYALARGPLAIAAWAAALPAATLLPLPDVAALPVVAAAWLTAAAGWASLELTAGGADEARS